MHINFDCRVIIVCSSNSFRKMRIKFDYYLQMEYIVISYSKKYVLETLGFCFSIFSYIILSWNTGNLGLKIIYSCLSQSFSQEYIILSLRSPVFQDKII